MRDGFGRNSRAAIFDAQNNRFLFRGRRNCDRPRVSRVTNRVAQNIGDRTQQQFGFGDDAKVVSNIDLIRQATVNAAECFGRVGDIGEILEGGLANIIAYRNDPLKDIQVLVNPEDNLSLIINRGVTVKDQV